MFRSQTSRAVARAARLAPMRKMASAASQAEILRKYPVGLSMHGFSVENVQSVPEFSLVAVQLKHTRTGLQHLHLDVPTDKNNVFSVAFKTNAPDATGVPHILEHTTLCGSYTYPVRDPFFKMLNRSLSNFMNAMTGHDYTYYPFATTNRKDYDNLMAVYLSSVFEPILLHEDFMQEGWRLEHQDVDDPKSPLEFKGVVYNEMKGQCSNASYLFWIKFQEAVYPLLGNSGGDPASIVDLQYEALVDFHAKNYHPSNAKTFTYGSFPLPEHLQKLNEQYGSFGSRVLTLQVQRPVFQTEPETMSRDVTVPGPVDSMASRPPSEQLKASVTWYLGDALDPGCHYEIFKWKALSSLLFDGHSAPFYRDLIESGFAEDFLPNSGLDVTSAMLSFTVGASNLTHEKVGQLPAKIHEILTASVLPELAKGSDSSFHARIQAIIHQLELAFKKHRPDFGLGLLHSLVPAWTNGGDPCQNLHVQAMLDRFKEDYERKGLLMFTELLEKLLLDSSAATLKFTMIPDEQYADTLLSQEKQALTARVLQLTDADNQLLYERSQALSKKQQQPEDVSVLPTLTIEDIPRSGDRHEVGFSKVAGSGGRIQTRATRTNGLVYMAAKKDVAYLPQRLVRYLPLFSSCLTNLAGTQVTPVTELETKIQLLTGGLSFSARAKTDPYNVAKPTLSFVLSGMALQENAQHIFDLWREIWLSTRFDSSDAVVDKLATLVRNLGQSQSDTIADRGHSYAGSFGSAQLTPTKKLTDSLSGVGQVQLVLEMNRKLEEQGTTYLKNELLPILNEIHNLMTQGHMGSCKGFNYSVVGESHAASQNELLISNFDAQVSGGGDPLSNRLDEMAASFQPSRVLKTILNLPFQVGYASLAKLGAPYTSKDGAALQVLSQLMTFKHLHSVVREANGAYGGGLSCDGLGGMLNFYSYRDPNAIKSAAAFAASPQAARASLKDCRWDAKAVQEAKLAIFQSVDAPSHVASEGSALFFDGITDEMKQQRRERFLDVTVDDLQDVNERYLVGGESNVYTVLGDASTLGVDDSWEVKAF